MEVSNNQQQYHVRTSNYEFTYDQGSNYCTLLREKEREILSFPTTSMIKFDGQTVQFQIDNHSFCDDHLLINYKDTDGIFEASTLRYDFLESHINVSLSIKPAKGIKIEEVILFQNGIKGMYMPHCTRYFCPTPRSNSSYYKNFPEVSIGSSYFTPSPLFFCIGSANGMVLFGLQDLPDSSEYKVTSDLGILLEKPCGWKTIRAGQTHCFPRLIIAFTEHEWDSPKLFRDVLQEVGAYQPTAIEDRNLPEWWKKPTVCTYGDQMMELQYNWYTDNDWDNPGYTQEWLLAWLDNAEAKLGMSDFTIIIDAFWQYRYSVSPYPCQERFKNLRSIIDLMHERGHKVILWCTPFIDHPYDDVPCLSKKHGLLSIPLSKSHLGFHTPGTFCLDFTADNAESFFDDWAHLMFGSDEGSLDADGIKADFLKTIQLPESGEYINPDKGIGFRELHRVYSMIMSSARKVKPDVLINASVADPRFEQLISINRLHDIQNLSYERQVRARLSAASSPNLPIDSDGAIMLSTNVKREYISATLYATPSLYYVRKFHDGISLSDETMRALGRLISLSEKKQWGKVCFSSYGNWELVCNGRVTARTYDGQAIIIFDEKAKGWLFTWTDGKQTIDLFNYIAEKIEPQPLEYTQLQDHITGIFESGVIYEITTRTNE